MGESALKNLPETYVDGFHDQEAVARMRYRRFGERNGDMKLSIVSLGGSSFGGVYEDVDKDVCAKIVQDALMRGVNLIDTAPWYGQGQSEDILGYALKEVPRSAYYLFTKIGRYELDVENMFDFTEARVRDSVEESMNRLGLNRLDCVQVHDPEFAPSIEIIVKETVPALQRLKEEGKIRMIGMTGYPLVLQREIIERCAADGIHIDSSLTYCHYSMNDTSLTDSPCAEDSDETFVDFLKRRQIGLISASPMSMGLLTNRGPPDWHPAGETLKRTCASAASYCRSLDPPVDISKLAMHFSLSCEDIPTVLVSFANPDIARESVRCGTIDAVLNAHEREALEYVMETYFGETLDSGSWPNTEESEYWRAMGKMLLTRAKYPKFNEF